MHQGKLVFAQIMTHLPLTTFKRCIAAHHGHHKVKTFTCLDQFFAMAFAQLTYRESLRDIEINLQAQAARLYHMGFRCKTIARSTLADANETRPWQIYADLAKHLIGIAKPLYVDEHLGVDLKNAVYAFDSTTIDLCLSVYPWAQFKATKGAIKLHTELDLRGSIPNSIHVSDGKVSDVRGFDKLVIEHGAIYLLDRGYLDFKRLHKLHSKGAFFVSRARSNTKLKRRYSHSVDRVNTNVQCDQTVVLAIPATASRYPGALRRVVVKDEMGKRISFLTNNFELSAQTIAALYKQRWQVELFFKWIKQHLRIKAFFGTSENAVKTQIWIAIATYVLIAITKKRLQLPQSLYEILQILSLTMFETAPLNQLLNGVADDFSHESDQIQPTLL